MKTNILTIHSTKGGVGKSATAITLAYVLSNLSYKVLLLDVDHHPAVTKHLIGIQEVVPSIREILLDGSEIDEVFVENNVGFDFIPSSLSLKHIEKELLDENNPLFLLYDNLERAFKNYDFVIIDTHPDNGLMTKSSILSSDIVIIPTQLEAWSIEDLNVSLNNINKIKSSQRYINTCLKKVFVLPTFFEERRQLSSSFLSSLQEFYSDELTQTVIHRSTDIAKTYSIPKAMLDLSSRGYKEYLSLVNEVLEVTTNE